MCHDGTRGFVQAKQLPADWLVARATTADLPNSHDAVAFLGDANGMDLNRSREGVVAKFKNLTGLKCFACDLRPHVSVHC